VSNKLTVEQAALKYIEENFMRHCCCVCDTDIEVGYDTLSDKSYCRDCLIEDLKQDEQALEKYYETNG
jgi:hypothetical protein